MALRDQLFLCLGMCTPQDEHASFRIVVDGANYLIGYGFPSLFCVAARIAFTNSERCVEKKNALLCPWRECSVHRRL